MKIDLKKAVITIAGGGTSQSIEVNVGEGTLTFSEKRNIEYVKDRGILDTTREGDQEPLDVKLDILWEHLNSDGSEPITPYEALTKTGAAAAWTSSAANPCEPYAVDLQIVYTPGCVSDTAETILIADFRYESIDGDIKAGTLSASGKANIIRPTVTRA